MNQVLLIMPWSCLIYVIIPLFSYFVHNYVSELTIITYHLATKSVLALKIDFTHDVTA